MGHPQYRASAGGLAADVPLDALGDFGESGNGPVVLDPEATDETVSGLPAGATGRPSVEIRMDALKGAGMAFWQGLFAARGDTSAPLWLEAWDPRTGGWAWFFGRLLRPKFASVNPAATQAGTVYRGVEIRLVEAEVAPLYVDSVNGSDSNSGLSADAALASIGALSGRIGAGTTVYLARGSHWREELTVAASSVSVLAYGEGDRPLLDGSDVIAAGSWSKTAGRTNVYQATVPIDALGSVGWVRAWENDATLVRASSVANCDATAGSYYPSADGAGPITLYVHASNHTNPATNGKVYEYNRREAGLFARSAWGLTVEGVHTRRNLRNDGSLVVGPFGTVRDCVASDGTKHNALFERGCEVFDTTADDAYYGGQALTLLVYNTDTADGEDVLFERCVARNATMVSSAAGFSGHSNAGGNFGTITLRDCVVENCDLAVEAVYVDLVVIDGLTSSGCRVIVRPVGPLAPRWDIGRVTHVGGDELLLRFESPVEVDLHHCDIRPAMALAGTIFVTAACELTIRDSVFVCTDSVGWPTWIQCAGAGAGASLTFLRNRLENYRGWQYYLLAAGPLESDYNTFVASEDKYHLNGTTYATLAAWQAAGFDVNSTAV